MSRWVNPQRVGLGDCFGGLQDELDGLADLERTMVATQRPRSSPSRYSMTM